MRSTLTRIASKLPGGERMIRRLRARVRFGRPRRAPSSPAASPRLVVILPDGGEGRAAELEPLSPSLEVAPSPPDDLAAGDYVHEPASTRGGLSAGALRNVLLSLAHQHLDFALVSTGLASPPRVRLGEPQDHLVLSRDAHRHWRQQGVLPPGARGRLLRLLPGRPDVAYRDVDLTELGLGALRSRGNELWVDGGSSAVEHPVSRRRPIAPLFRPDPGDRPTILVIPVFLAVGGVERNLVAILRQLHTRYAFLLATTEPLREDLGSLNHQAEGLCEGLFDLAEVADLDRHLDLFEAIRDAYRPDLVWICNGSPWLLTHSAALRETFRDVPIVDQQVYDTRFGWIEHYADPGIQSFDRFVAINSRIRTAFVDRIGIQPEKIDLIYPAFDGDRFTPADAPPKPRPDLPPPDGRRRFLQVGRLHEQKRPLDFLDLARRCRDAGLDDFFCLVGDGELAEACDRYIQEHRLDNVRRIPFCDDMSQLYPHFDGLLITSEYEGLPVTLLEALAMGLPALSTDVGDVALVLDETRAGRIVGQIGDAEGLLRDFLEWRDGLDALAARARAASPEIRARFSASAIAVQYEESWARAWQARSSARTSRLETSR